MVEVVDMVEEGMVEVVDMVKEEVEVEGDMVMEEVEVEGDMVMEEVLTADLTHPSTQLHLHLPTAKETS